MPRIKPPAATGGKKLAAPPTDPTPDHNHEPPAFCFRYLVAGHGIVECTSQEKISLINTIWQLSQRSWLELILSGRHGSGCEKINAAALRVGRPAFLSEEVTFLSFRFCAKAPMIGFREGRTFHVLWLDREFKVYKH